MKVVVTYKQVSGTDCFFAASFCQLHPLTTRQQTQTYLQHTLQLSESQMIVLTIHFTGN